MLPLAHADVHDQHRLDVEAVRVHQGQVGGQGRLHDADRRGDVHEGLAHDIHHSAERTAEAAGGEPTLVFVTPDHEALVLDHGGEALHGARTRVAADELRNSGGVLRQVLAHLPEEGGADLDDVEISAVGQVTDLGVQHLARVDQLRLVVVMIRDVALLDAESLEKRVVPAGEGNFLHDASVSRKLTSARCCPQVVLL